MAGDGREKGDAGEARSDQEAETPTSGKTTEPSEPPSWTDDGGSPTTDEPAED
jgi:hypothetical protein